MHHRAITVLLAALFLTSNSAAAQTEQTTNTRPPNIVFILADDMGFSDLGCYGSEIRTPNLDRLAAAGLRFTQFYNTSKCFTSRACLMTGAYAQQVNMGRGPGVFKNAVTFGSVLRTAGYRTLMTGKHHGTQNPFTLGFDRYFGLRDGACNYFNPGAQRPGEPKPAQKRRNRAFCLDGKTLQPFTPKDPKFYTTDAFTDYALQFLSEYEKESKPFFLYIAYNAPHDPLHAWPEDIAKYDGKYDAGYAATRQGRVARQRAMKMFEAKPSDPTHQDWGSLSDAERQTEIRRMAVYAAMVDRMDQNIGRVIDKIKAMGELDNTLIMFASDNGGSSEVVRRGSGEIGAMTRWASVKGDWANVSNTPFRRFKNHSHEGGICTPLIVHWPARIGQAQRGSIVRTPTHFIDVMATYVDITGASYPTKVADESITPMQGVSLVPLFDGEAIQRGKPLFWQWASGRAMRDGKWKIVNHRKGWELYDMSLSRNESENLATRFPQQLASMVTTFNAWFANLPKAHAKAEARAKARKKQKNKKKK